MSKSDLEKLTFELNKIKELNSKLLENNIQPILKEKVQDFLDAFEDYFRERGLVVNAGHLTVRAALDSLEFTAFSKGDPTIFILKDRETIASISVKYKTPTRSASYQFDTEEEQLKWEIKKENTLFSYLENPEFYYTGSEFGRPYYDPLVVLESIFHV